MINFVYRLVAAKQIRVDYLQETINSDKVVVRPRYLSICAADQRYYFGKRDPEAMKKKLPMALIHEGVGEVIYDRSGTFKAGDMVVMIPNTPMEDDEITKENYRRSSRFRASGFDGFMQDLVFMRADRLIKFSDIPLEVSSFMELISVTMNACERFAAISLPRKKRLGVWGDGSVGFVMALVLQNEYPEAEIFVVGASAEKLSHFSFIKQRYMVDSLPADFKVDHGFECVGGNFSSSAINQIIDYIEPQGTINLLGVSENEVAINTRMVLEKGLSLIGHSRSSYADFAKAVKLLSGNPAVSRYLQSIVSDLVEVDSIEDIHRAFMLDQTSQFKTVMKWNL